MRGEERPEDVDELMRQLGVDPKRLVRPSPPPAIPPEGPPPSAPPDAPAPAAFEPLEPPPTPAPPAGGGLDFLADVGVRVRIELGRARLSVQDILRLGTGSVVPLESLTADPVSVYVNDRLVARGEVLVVNDNFAVRITEVVPPGGPPEPPRT